MNLPVRKILLVMWLIVMERTELTFLTDGKYHLICKPFTISNLHKMANILNIDKCHFEYSAHGHLPHYDIPRKRKHEIEEKCVFVKWREIVEIIKSSEYYLTRKPIKVKKRK